MKQLWEEPVSQSDKGYNWVLPSNGMPSHKMVLQNWCNIFDDEVILKFYTFISHTVNRKDWTGLIYSQEGTASINALWLTEDGNKVEGFRWGKSFSSIMFPLPSRTRKSSSLCWNKLSLPWRKEQLPLLKCPYKKDCGRKIRLSMNL